MAYEIEFIADSRDGGTRKKLQQMNRQLKKDLREFRGCVSLRDKSSIRELSFMRKEIPAIDRGKQWRKKYVVEKKCIKPTWNEVMRKINKIQPPYYKRV